MVFSTQKYVFLQKKVPLPPSIITKNAYIHSSFFGISESLQLRKHRTKTTLPKPHTMLLNLSNHPSPNWHTKQQKVAVEKYGEIQDLPFPNIPPHCSSEEVKDLAQDYLQKILILKREQAELTVHLMGELTFTFTLLQLLLKEKIPCVASTSERMTQEGENGTKIIRFEFVRFRNYDLT